MVELSAIYDTLIRSDSESGSFVPQLAESIDSNDDFTSFTVKLRDGATFIDGSALDADAVKWSIDRFVAAKADVAQTWSSLVEEVSTPDAATVEFTPIGAGPFTLEKFAPSEEIVLNPREDYFDGTPHLSKLRFVPTAAAQSQLESLNSGQLNMAYILRDESVIKTALDVNYAGFVDVQGLGAIGTIKLTYLTMTEPSAEAAALAAQASLNAVGFDVSID